MLDFAVVGSGIGGSCSALMLSKYYDTLLLEKDSNLGGCCSTFKRFGHYYNSGATTFAGFAKNSYIYNLFHSHNVTFKSQLLKSAVTVYQNGKTIKRYSDLERFIDEINRVHFHPKNSAFYTLIARINQEFYTYQEYHYSNQSIVKKIKSLTSFLPLLLKFGPYLFIEAKSFLLRYFKDISQEYLDFINNQLIIVAQAKLTQVNFLTLALALGYQFQENRYIIGGMGSIFEAIASHINLKRNCEILQIEKRKNHYILHAKNRSFEAKNIVLNSTMFDSSRLFTDKEIINYFKKYQNYDSNTSAFILYLQIDSHKEFDHHCQIIEKEIFPYTISNSIFVSFGDKNDERMKNSVTISIHVNKQTWNENWEIKSEQLTQAILKSLEKNLELSKSEIKRYFSAKPHTFARFINRSSLGGVPMKKEHLLHKLPSNDTPIQGLYMVGDTTYAAQGWPGVMMGVKNLERLLCKR